VDGKAWPVQSATAIYLPAGSHRIESAPKRDGITLIDLNATLRSATGESKRLTFEYSSESRAIARFDRTPSRIEVDGETFPVESVVLLPRGTHRVTAN
jgi:hypothetical protein